MLQKSTCTSAVSFQGLNIISKSAVRAHKITEPVFFIATLNSKHYVQFPLTPFIGKKIRIYFMQDSAMAHMANFSMTVAKGVI
jgi:hypothetical protein